MAANRQTYIHTHVCNAVTLVWGSLRLAPINPRAFSLCDIASFPGTKEGEKGNLRTRLHVVLIIQFLIACSMQKLSGSIFAYCNRSKAGAGEGLGPG